MSTTMTAAVVHEFGRDLAVEEYTLPEPGPGQALVKLISTGVCHTDLHAAEGDWPVKPSPPFVPGHEGVGTVEKVGEGVTDVKVGDMIGNAWLWSACGDCQYCRTGWETLCEEQDNGGYSVDGSFGQYMLVETKFAARIPEGADPYEIAPVLCAGVTVYKGLKQTEVRPGQWVVISGIGGLGHIAVQYAVAMGMRVIAVDIAQEKLDLATKHGAEITVDASVEDPVTVIQEKVGGSHGVLVTAVHPKAFGQAIGMTRRGGTIVFNGLPPGRLPRPDLRHRAQGADDPRLDRRHPSGPRRGDRVLRRREDPPHLLAARAGGHQPGARGDEGGQDRRPRGHRVLSAALAADGARRTAGQEARPAGPLGVYAGGGSDPRPGATTRRPRGEGPCRTCSTYPGRSRSVRSGPAKQPRIVLRAAGGIANTEITERVRKATDLCGLHLGASEDIPANAIALSIDEKSQIQTPDRTVPILPMQPGPIERRSHDYCRHDATTLIAALEIATGKVTATLKTRHRNQEFLAYLKHVDHTYRDAIEPGTGQRFELHLVMDDYAAHKHREVRAWMESPHLRVHFTPTHASWMNLVEV